MFPGLGEGMLKLKVRQRDKAIESILADYVSRGRDGNKLVAVVSDFSRRVYVHPQ